MDKIETLTTLMNEKQCEEVASKVVQDNKPVSVKTSIKDVQNVTYDEELSEKLGNSCQTENIKTNNCKSFKHLIEYDEHTWLVESNYEFQQLTFDPKDGYMPRLTGVHIKEINLKDDIEEPEKPPESQIKKLFSANFWAMKTDFSLRVLVIGFESPKNIVKYIKFSEHNNNEQEQYCSFNDFFMMFEPWKDGV